MNGISYYLPQAFNKASSIICKFIFFFQVKVVCISLTKIDLTSNRKSEADDKANKLDLAVPYKPISTNRVRYIAITFMKVLDS